MSRIGRQNVVIPKGVEVKITPAEILAKGPKGSLAVKKHAAITVKQEGGELVFARSGNEGAQRAAHGLMRALVANMMTGVTKGFERQLEINGVGYKAELKGQAL